jgi:phage terminase Nu1 subunit (DNA packaging protein)
MAEVNQQNIAAHLNCDVATIRAYVANGTITKLPDGKYDETDCRNRAFEMLRNKAAGRAGTPEGTGLTTERALLAKEQRESISLKNQISRGDLVSLDIVKRVWAVILAVIRERLLSIPGKLADALAMRTREEIELILRGEIVETLNELHDPTDDAFRNRLGGRPGSSQGPQAAPDAHPD